MLLVGGCGGPAADDAGGEEPADAFEAELDAGGTDAFVSVEDDGGTPSIDAWSAPDAFAEACPTEGAMRTQACGNCGLGSQRCTEGTWVSAGPCVGEGECAAGSLETRTTDTCAEEARICPDSCAWT